jgi:D-3-phosphoglycerate dehydrogenase
MAVARKLNLAGAELRSGTWNRERAVGVELYRKTLGIVGLGRIGSRIARHARGFDMHVIACDPYIDPKRARRLDVILVDLETLLRRSDFVSLHVPLTEETRGMIGQSELALMKPSAILANTARGGVIEEEALLEALAGRRIAGAALDVYAEEPLPAGHPLTQLDNVVCTPHCAGQTDEALVRVSVRAAENILYVYRGEVPPLVVNPEALENGSRAG